MTLRAIVIALVAATVLAVLATDAVLRAPTGPCNDVVAVEPEQKSLPGQAVVVATAGQRQEKTFGGYDYELGALKLDCEETKYGGNDAHALTYDTCIVRPVDACHPSAGMPTGLMFNASLSELEHDPAADIYLVRVRSPNTASTGTRAFEIVKGTRPKTSFAPLALIAVCLAIAFQAAIVLGRRERRIARLNEGIIDESGRVQPKGGGPAFAAAPHAFRTGDEVTFGAPAREPTYRAEDVVPIFASLKAQTKALAAIRFRAWAAILGALVASTLVALFVR